MSPVLAGVGAAVAGCFAVRGVVWRDRPVWWLLPGLAPPALFAWLPTLVDSRHAGRACTACGVDVAASLAWPCAVEGACPDRLDVIAAAVCRAGMATALFGPEGVSTT